MSKRAPSDFLLILAIYAIYWALVYFATLPDNDWPAELGILPGANVDAETFLDEIRVWSLVVMGTSLLAVFGWYVLGEWGLRPQTTSSTWLAVWLLGLALTLAVGFLAFNFGPQPSEGGSALLAVYLVSGAFFYYLATMLFSPVNVKFIVPGSRWIRRW